MDKEEDIYGKMLMMLQEKQEQMLQKLLQKVKFEKLQKGLEILLEIKQLIWLLQQVNQNKKERKQKKFTFHQRKDNKLLMILNRFEHKM